MISDDLAAFLESGVSVLVGTRDDQLVPESSRAFGARVGAGGAELTVFLPEAFSARGLSNLRANGRIAVCFSRPSDNRAIQLKGRVLDIREAGEVDRPCVERYRRLWSETLGWVGIPPRILARVAHWPCQAVRFRVEAVFVQTPGPGAGAPLGPQQGAAR